MAESSSDKYTYENEIAERFRGQTEMELVVPTPSVLPAPDADDSEFLKALEKLAWIEEDDKASQPKEAAN